MSEKLLCVLCAILLVVTFNVLGQAQLNDRYTKEAVVVEVQGHTISAEDTTRTWSVATT